MYIRIYMYIHIYIYNISGCLAVPGNSEMNLVKFTFP